MLNGMTLGRLSRLAGVNIRALDMFEMGKAEINLQHLLPISGALGCDISALLE